MSSCNGVIVPTEITINSNGESNSVVGGISFYSDYSQINIKYDSVDLELKAFDNTITFTSKGEANYTMTLVKGMASDFIIKSLGYEIFANAELISYKNVKQKNMQELSINYKLTYNNTESVIQNIDIVCIFDI